MKKSALIDHYLLDEFQDTSALQWENFKTIDRKQSYRQLYQPDCGDVKQSIYRWRNSNWRILGQQLQEEYQEEIKNIHYKQTGEVMKILSISTTHFQIIY